MRRRVSAGRGEIRRGVQIVVLLTVGFAVFLVMFGRGYVKPYDTAAGQVALLVVAAMFTAGFVWMRKLSGSVPLAPFLSRPGQRPDPDDVQLVATLTGITPAMSQGLIEEPAAPALRPEGPR